MKSLDGAHFLRSVPQNQILENSNSRRFQIPEFIFYWSSTGHVERRLWKPFQTHSMEHLMLSTSTRSSKLTPKGFSWSLESFSFRWLLVCWKHKGGPWGWCIIQPMVWLTFETKENYFRKVKNDYSKATHCVLLCGYNIFCVDLYGDVHYL